MPAGARRRCGGRRVALAAALVAGLVAAAAQAQSPNQSTGNPAGSVAGYPVTPQPVPGLKKCSCKDLKEHLEEVEKKEKCYEKAYEHHRTMDNPWGRTDVDHANLNNFIKDCMGWTTVYNIGSSGANSGETKQQQEERAKTDREKCDETRCEWICRVSVWTVHEPGHTWYDLNVKVNNFVFFGNALVGRAGVLVMRDFIQREIAGHLSEMQFLKETLDEAERTGKCDHIRRTIDQKELDELWKMGLRRAEKYVEDLP